MGYATGQFGKNHLGDLNQFLPTVHGFDEFFGYLYHLDAMEDPCHRNYPQALKDTVGPAQHAPLLGDATWTIRPCSRAGARSASRRSRTPASSIPKRMETVDDEILDNALKFIDKARKDDKPFFLWLNPTRMHVVTHLSDKYESDAQLGERLEHPGSRHGAARRHRRLGDEVPEGQRSRRQHHHRLHAPTTAPRTSPGPTAARRRSPAARERRSKAASACPAIIRWPGKVPAGKVENGIVSGLDWFPTFVAAAGNPEHRRRTASKGKQLGDRNYKVHLDGYNQMDLITGKGPSKRHEIFYFTESTLSAVRIDDYKYRFTDQPNGWLGATEKVDWPILVNLRLDPFERTGMSNGKDNGSIAYYNWFAYEFWRFVFVQQEVGKAAQTLRRVPADAKGRELQHGGGQGADSEGGCGTYRRIDQLVRNAVCERPPMDARRQRSGSSTRKEPGFR